MEEAEDSLPVESGQDAVEEGAPGDANDDSLGQEPVEHEGPPREDDAFGQEQVEVAQSVPGQDHGGVEQQAEAAESQAEATEQSPPETTEQSPPETTEQSPPATEAADTSEPLAETNIAHQVAPPAPSMEESASVKAAAQQSTAPAKDPPPAHKPAPPDDRVMASKNYNAAKLRSERTSSRGFLDGDMLSIYHSFGFETTRRNNLHRLGSTTLLSVAGNAIFLLDLESL